MKYRWIFYAGNGIPIAQGFDVESRRAARKQFEKTIEKIKDGKRRYGFVIFDSENFPEMF